MTEQSGDDEAVTKPESESDSATDPTCRNGLQASRTCASRRVIGEQKAAQGLLGSFLSGKTLYIGGAEPYQFVMLPECGRVGLWQPSCPCPMHQRGGGAHVLNLSEVTLLLECGAERAWVFMSIPDQYRDNYAWLPTVGFGGGDMELCGVLVDTV